VIFYRQKKGFKIAEIWYSLQEPMDKKVDVLRCRYVPNLRKNAFSVEKKYTLITDLSKSEEELFSLIRKNTRYEIKRARDKDTIKCSTFLERNEANREKLLQYIDFFNLFAASKRRTLIHPSEFDEFCGNGTLCIRTAAKDSQILVMHSYIVSDGIARLYQSASHFRDNNDQEFKNLTGRANRLLHWDDIIFFKNQSLAYYDYGGVYAGNKDREKLAIAQFKLAFGGTKRQEYLYIVPVSLLGVFSVFLHAIHRICEKSFWLFKRTFTA
jgi:lipid II:glycine glycyltransferase (peptidoglycan interpeptide bridge formation enzyme)